MFGDNEELSQTVVVMPEENTTLPQHVTDDFHTDNSSKCQSGMSLTNPSNEVHALQCSDDNPATKVRGVLIVIYCYYSSFITLCTLYL